MLKIVAVTTIAGYGCLVNDDDDEEKMRRRLEVSNNKCSIRAVHHKTGGFMHQRLKGRYYTMKMMITWHLESCIATMSFVIFSTVCAAHSAQIWNIWEACDLRHPQHSACRLEGEREGKIWMSGQKDGCVYTHIIG